MKTCVTPEGHFRYGIHKPSYEVHNLREHNHIEPLGLFSDGSKKDNQVNFPKGRLHVEAADWIYEIPNPFPFRGTTYITRSWAEGRSANLEHLRIPKPPEVSMSKYFSDILPHATESTEKLFSALPKPVLLALAANSSDPTDLALLAELSCEIIYGPDRQPIGLAYTKDANGTTKSVIKNSSLFEIVVNNPFLPDPYKEVMVLKPGVQGGSEIVGEIKAGETHIFEYLRRNSYIPWGHYAANMANDAIRYDIDHVTIHDIDGLRHLYYQRTYTRMAEELGLALPEERQTLPPEALEQLRLNIHEKLTNKDTCSSLKFSGTLWGWNYGFDCAASNYRLHASHQMVHQQFALLPDRLDPEGAGSAEHNTDFFSPYACGDLVADFISSYKQEYNSCFFEDYLAAIRNNRRIDGKADKEKSLIIYEDNNVILFVPKAQTSQWELQLMATNEVGNILEADTNTRKSFNFAMLTAMKALTGLGAKMISTIEFSKRFTGQDNSQRLLYSFLPKLPQSPGAFSEAQLRWINGHYPEDFAKACRLELQKQ